MNKELTLLIPDSLLLQLELKARAQGVSLEALCLSLLSSDKPEDDLVDPSYYRSLTHATMRQELNKVIVSSLPSEEKRRRLNRLEFEISSRYR